MKKLILSSIAILFFSLSSFSQTLKLTKPGKPISKLLYTYTGTPLKVVLTSIPEGGTFGGDFQFYASFIDTTVDLIIDQYQGNLLINGELVKYSVPELDSLVMDETLQYASSQSYNISYIVNYGLAWQSNWTQTDNRACDFIKNKPTIPTVPSSLISSQTFTASRSFVTTAAAANGFQLSATHTSVATYSVNINVVSSIGSNEDGYIVAEVAPTNSTTAADWKEMGRVRIGDTLALALTLSSTKDLSGQLVVIVPAGYYVRLRTVDVAGTPTYTYINGSEFVTVF